MNKWNKNQSDSPSPKNKTYAIEPTLHLIDDFQKQECLRLPRPPLSSLPSSATVWEVPGDQKYKNIKNMPLWEVSGDQNHLLLSTSTLSPDGWRRDWEMKWKSSLWLKGAKGSQNGQRFFCPVFRKWDFRLGENHNLHLPARKPRRFVSLK